MFYFGVSYSCIYFQKYIIRKAELKCNSCESLLHVVLLLCLDTNPLVDSCVQERQRQLKRCRLQENLSDHLVHRPGPLDLVHANILKIDPELFGGL